MRDRRGISAASILLNAALFTFSFAAGFMAGPPYSSEVVEPLEEGLAWLFNLPPPMLFLAIFANNTVKTLAAVVLGVALTVPPIFFVMFNGVVLGLVSFEIVRSRGLLTLMAGLLPHGVFEIPALILSAALGVQLGLTVYRRLRGREAQVRRVFRLSLKIYVFRVLPLLALAAFMEVFVSPVLMGAVPAGW